MIAITLFYVLFLILLILLIFVILLYSGYHSRTLAPPLLDTFYGLAGDISGGSIGTSFKSLYLADGAVTSNGVSGSLDFGTSGSTHQEFGFRPMWDDSQRKLRGNITLLINKQSTAEGIEFRLVDGGDNKTVGEATEFNIQDYDKGLTEIKLYFTSNNLSGTNYHRFILEGKGTSSAIPANDILVNSAYMYYY